MVPRARLVKRILKKLGSWQAGQDLPAEDYVAVDEELDSLLVAMARADIYVVDDPKEGVPEEAYPDLATYLANELVDDFGITGEEAAGLAQRAGLSEKALRYLRVSRVTREVVTGSYF